VTQIPIGQLRSQPGVALRQIARDNGLIQGELKILILEETAIHGLQSNPPRRGKEREGEGF
jgi:hypothetical protein